MNASSLIDKLGEPSDPANSVQDLPPGFRRRSGIWKNDQTTSGIRASVLVKRPISEREGDGRIPFHPYGKYYGLHWVLTDLADLYYAPGDNSLLPPRTQEYDWLFSELHLETAPFSKPRSGTLFSPDRPRIHASMEANRILSLLRLGLNDEKLISWLTGC